MNALGWILLAAGNIVSGALGWQIRGHLAERAQFREWQQRDREWDERHGIRRG